MTINTFSLLIIFSFVLYFNELSIARFNTDFMATAAILFLCVYLNIIQFFQIRQLEKKPFLPSEFSENPSRTYVKF